MLHINRKQLAIDIVKTTRRFSCPIYIFFGNQYVDAARIVPMLKAVNYFEPQGIQVHVFVDQGDRTTTKEVIEVFSVLERIYGLDWEYFNSGAINTEIYTEFI